jgi:hypothetical protein
MAFFWIYVCIIPIFESVKVEERSGQKVDHVIKTMLTNEVF